MTPPLPTRTHCSRGHKLSSDNLALRRGGKGEYWACLTCRREDNRHWDHKKRKNEPAKPPQERHNCPGCGHYLPLGKTLCPNCEEATMPTDSFLHNRKPEKMPPLKKRVCCSCWNTDCLRDRVKKDKSLDGCTIWGKER